MTGQLIWWSTNTRAASALLLASLKAGIPTGLALDPAAPQPSNNLLRKVPTVAISGGGVSVEDVVRVAEKTADLLGVSQIVLAPTSEYLVRLMSNGHIASNLTLVIPPLSSRNYNEISDKSNLYQFDTGGVSVMPKLLQNPDYTKKFVAKPIKNIGNDGKAKKPFIVSNLKGFKTFVAQSSDYFAQEFIPGPSRYLCGFYDRNHFSACFVQDNLKQLPGGGSITLARRSNHKINDLSRGFIESFLGSASFVGPVMFELRGPRDLIIEVNPRFWGPLLLDLSSEGGVLGRYFERFFGSSLPELPAEYLTNSYIVPSGLGQSEAVEGFSISLQAEALAVQSENASRLKEILGGDW